MNEIFSPREKKVLSILGKRKMTISQVTERMFSEVRKEDANNGVAHAVRRINIKCKYHKLPWFLNSSGIGRGGKTIWKDER